MKPHYKQAHMSTIVVYGWDKWKEVIGEEGVAIAKRMITDFDLDPVRNVEKPDVSALARSLKIIMSSKLVGLDHYLEDNPESLHAQKMEAKKAAKEESKGMVIDEPNEKDPIDYDDEIGDKEELSFWTNYLMKKYKLKPALLENKDN